MGGQMNEWMSAWANEVKCSHDMYEYKYDYTDMLHTQQHTYIYRHKGHGRVVCRNMKWQIIVNNNNINKDICSVRAYLSRIKQGWNAVTQNANNDTYTLTHTYICTYTWYINTCIWTWMERKRVWLHATVNVYLLNFNVAHVHKHTIRIILICYMYVCICLIFTYFNIACSEIY